MKIGVVTGSRADLGPLKPVCDVLQGHWVNVTPEPSYVAYDSAVSCGSSMISAAKQFEELKPDLVVLLGDRYEILGAASAAFLMNIPIAHLSGGDVTLGSQDNAIRDAITKLAHIHFTTNGPAGKRIIDMGEDTWRVHVVGCPGIDSIPTELLSIFEVKRKIGIEYPYYLVAYQPSTLAEDPIEEARCLVYALSRLTLPCVFTSLNADNYGMQIDQLFRLLTLDGRGVILEMDRKLYLSVMKYCTVMIGNSSSGFYEAPSLKVPFVNVGSRQSGRISSPSIVHCAAHEDEIIAAVRYARKLDCAGVINPYGDGHSAERIRDVISKLPSKARLLRQVGGSTGIRQGMGSNT